MPAIFQALLPVIVLIACGYLTGRNGLGVGPRLARFEQAAVQCAGSRVVVSHLVRGAFRATRFKPVMMYHTLTLAWLTLWVAVYGLTQRGCMRALAGTYSNAVMIGIPFISLAYGPEGQVYIMTLVSVHALIILTYATLLFELAGARDSPSRAGPCAAVTACHLVEDHQRRCAAPCVIACIRRFAVCPNRLGAARSHRQTHGVDGPGLFALGLAVGGHTVVSSAGQRLALAFVFQHLWSSSIRWHEVLQVVALKNLLHPLLIFAGGWWLGLPLLPMTVMMVTACMPVGINSYLFATRYQGLEAEVSLSLSLSVMCAVVSVPLMLALQKILMVG
jgi:malonate transporter and related proteins